MRTRAAAVRRLEQLQSIELALENVPGGSSIELGVSQLQAMLRRYLITSLCNEAWTAVSSAKRTNAS
jgi:hypothetical protein